MESRSQPPPSPAWIYKSSWPHSCSSKSDNISDAPLEFGNKVLITDFIETKSTNKRDFSSTYVTCVNLSCKLTRTRYNFYACKVVNHQNLKNGPLICKEFCSESRNTSVLWSLQLSLSSWHAYKNATENYNYSENTNYLILMNYQLL